MYYLVLAGGSGTRLWPLSRERKPKQVVAPLGGKTLLRRTIDRLRTFVKPREIFIVASVIDRQYVHHELPAWSRDNLVFEPCRRGTAAAIGFGLLRILARDPHAVVTTVNSDAWVTDLPAYRRSLRIAEQVIMENPRHTVVIGVRPSYPECSYGYIKLGTSVWKGADGEAFAVDRFIEKPDIDSAALYVASGDYLWNTTMLVAHGKHLWPLFAKHLPGHAATLRTIAADRAGRRMAKTFANLPMESIDYGILEKEDRLLAIAAEFGWSDIGTWRSVKDALESDPMKNAVLGDCVTIAAAGNIISAPKGKLVALVGVSDTAIIDTKDALLVCRRERSGEVKKVVEELKKRRSLKKYA